MKWLDLALPLVKVSEGFSATAYPDPATGGKPYTIGYGRTGEVQLGDTTTREAEEKWIRDRLQENDRMIMKSVNSIPTPQERAALADFVYNVGIGAFRSSTLCHLVSVGDMEAAANEFSKWKYADGKILPGLVKRRERERSLFLTGEWL